MRGSWHSSGQQDEGLLGGISEEALFLTKKGLLVGTLFFAHFLFPNFSLPGTRMSCLKVKQPACSYEAAMKQQEWEQAYELWMLAQKEGMSLGPRWQAHL